MTGLMIFKNPEFGEVRTVEIDGNIWLVGIDVARGLGYGDPLGAVNRHVDEDDQCKQQVIDSMGRPQQTKIINESGLYALTINSELPAAKKFKRWITKEVIPSIVRTGGYGVPALSPNEMILQLAQSNVDLDRKVNAHEEKIMAIEEKVEEIIRAEPPPPEEPVIPEGFYEFMPPRYYRTGTVAKAFGITSKIMNKFLKAAGVVTEDRNGWALTEPYHAKTTHGRA